MDDRDGQTFVLVHGGYHGGWCWRPVATRLRALGHAVYTPTQTGCGERSHLLSASITLDTFVDDIANVLVWEDLDRVVLVGHSFGGLAISGVADRMPGRLRRLVYLDALVLEDGQSVFGLLGPEAVRRRLKDAEPSGGLAMDPPPAAFFGIDEPALAAFVEARLTRHPVGTYASPLRLAHPLCNGVPALYVRCTDPPLAAVEPSWRRAAGYGMQLAELRAGHDAMLTAPLQVAELLHEAARGVG